VNNLFLGIALLLVSILLLVANKLGLLSTPTLEKAANIATIVGFIGGITVLILQSGDLYPSPPATPETRETSVPSILPSQESASSSSSPGEEQMIGSAPMVLIPAGDFVMGSSDQEIDQVISLCENCKREWFTNEMPQHTVYLDAYWMDKFEVTNAQYEKCVGDRRCALPQQITSYHRDSYYGNVQYNNHPVIHVTWDDAVAYCEWDRKRLPTEAEWEKAARGTDKRMYPWGNIFDSSKLNSGRTVDDTSAVGSYLTGASPYGIMDLAGNIDEWVNDWYGIDYYAVSSQRNPTGPLTGSAHVLRGGSWLDGPDFTRTAIRLVGELTPREIFGFRCAKSFSP
jgi:eukaryotic-like serine/threonine-protein kinase